ncbi:MAG: phage terminase large subunit [Verrucomicrobia bacterium]|nr:phage terminase large subunit [Verrucomicrobiota bacterium]
MRLDHPVWRAAAAAWRPQSPLLSWKWTEENVYAEPGSPIPGRIRLDNSPWLKEPMEEVPNNRRRRIIVMCAAQSSKTTFGVLSKMWAISEAPGRGQWVTSDADMAKDDLRDRFMPMFLRCRPVRDQMISSSVEDVVFRTMPLYYSGSNSKAKLQSKPLRWLWLDEVRNFPKNALPMVLKRVRAYWNSRIIMMSTPGDEGQNIHHHYLQGDQRVWNSRCPNCGDLFELKFEDLVAVHPENGGECRFRDVPGAFEEDGTCNGDVLAPFIRCKCPGCHTLMEDTPAVRKAMAREGAYVATRPDAPAETVSFTWSALVPFWVSWRSVVQEYFDALVAIRAGDTEPMRTFVTETLGRPWREDMGELEDFGTLEDRREDYSLGEVWADEQTRFMSADRQAKGGEHYFWVVRSFSSTGENRLIAHGKVETKEALEQKRIEHEVPIRNCALDTGHMATDCYRFCLATGWKAFKGEENEWFIISEVGPDGKKRQVRRSWDRSVVDANQGRAGKRRLLKLYRWSNQRLFDLLASCMGGIIPGWTLPKETERAYMRHLMAYVREEVADKLGRPKRVWRKRWEDDHYRDCELQILVMAVICKLIRGPERKAGRGAEGVGNLVIPPIDDGPPISGEGGEAARSSGREDTSAGA